MNIGDIVRHSMDAFEEPLIVRRKFFWFGNEKMVCENLAGYFTKDWVYEFLLVLSKENLELFVSK